jgi:hypothetical protein
MAGRPLPDEPWLARDMRRLQAAETDRPLARLAAMRGHPLVAAGWPDEVYDGVLAFCVRRVSASQATA